MSTSLFQVTEHVLPCAHIREYYHGVRDEAAPLRLVVKEYRPLNDLQPELGSVTVIATTPNAFPKECFEPLWDDIIRAPSTPKIRGIWVADACYNGASGVLNEDVLGDDPSWFDHSRDLLSMVNHFRERMIRPIFGIGCCRGAAEMVNLSLIHPRLFHSLALFEPIIQNDVPPGPVAAMPSTLRPDWWPSREEAASSFRKNRMFSAWDPRVLDMFISHGLRDLPTPLYHTKPSSEPNVDSPTTREFPVTLTTSKHQEAWSYVRPNFAPRPASNPTADRQERLLSPDLDPTAQGTYLFHRAEAVLANINLPYLRPHVLWIFGERSPINSRNLQDEKLSRTGSGVGGSGGAQLGKVEKTIIPKTAHLVMFEQVGKSAEILAQWMHKQTQTFEEDETFHRRETSGKSKDSMLRMSDLWIENVRRPSDTKRPTREKL